MADGIIAIPLAGQPLAGEAGFDDVRPLRTAMVPYSAGPENRLLPPAVRGVLEARAATHNSLVFYGPTGTGKSHLARGLAAVWRERFPNQTVAYTNATDFARELADAIETQAVVDLRGRYRGVSLLVFEDVGRLAEKAAAQVELIHTLDAVLQEGGQVVVTASAPPAELKDLMPGLQSRLVGGLVLPLLPPGPGGPTGHLAAVGCPARNRLVRFGGAVAGRWTRRHGAGTAGGAVATARPGPRRRNAD